MRLVVEVIATVAPAAASSFAAANPIPFGCARAGHQRHPTGDATGRIHPLIFHDSLYERFRDCRVASCLADGKLTTPLQNPPRIRYDIASGRRTGSLRIR